MLEVCTTLLQACAAAGLTLAEIAGVVTRPLIGMEEEPSELERICFNARAEVEELSDDDDECCGIDVIAEAAEEGESEGGCWGLRGVGPGGRTGRRVFCRAAGDCFY